MADTKISALPAATTPLGGTEVLPIVQGGITEKVSVANLTAGRSVSALQYQAAINSATAWAPDTSATNIQINNSAAAANSTALYVATVNDDASTQGGVKFGAVAVASGTSGGYSADFVIANRKTGTYQENIRVAWNGNVTVNTGNLVIGTSGKGIDFSATPGTGTSELLNDYEEGTFTAARTGFTEVLGGGTITSTGTYTKVGRLVTVNITLECTGAATIAGISGAVSYFDLPFTSGYDAAGVWANRTLVNANGGVLVNSAQMYLTTGWAASGNTRLFSVTYSV